MDEKLNNNEEKKKNQIEENPSKAEKQAQSVPKASIGEEKTGKVAKISRRSAFSWLGVAWVAFSAATLAFLTMIMRFLYPNVLFEPPLTFKVGFADDYAIGAVDERWKEQFGIWLIRTSRYIYVLSTTCTHLGCTPNWLKNDRKFKCPCHGSGFYQTGINFEGPAPRPLERFRIVLAEDGQILVDKTRKYQQEKGEWNDPDSFLPV